MNLSGMLEAYFPHGPAQRPELIKWKQGIKITRCCKQSCEARKFLKKHFVHGVELCGVRLQGGWCNQRKKGTLFKRIWTTRSQDIKALPMICPKYVIS